MSINDVVDGLAMDDEILVSDIAKAHSQIVNHFAPLPTALGVNLADAVH